MKIVMHLLFSSAVFLATSGAVEPEAEAFEYQYIANCFPSDATPPWKKSGTAKESAAILVDGKMKVDLSRAETLFWRIGIDKTSECGDTTAWNLTASGVATIVFELRCEAEDAQDAIFELAVGSASGALRYRFFKDRVGVGKEEFPCDTAESDVYRIVIEGGQSTLYSEKKGLIVKSLRLGGEKNRNIIWFGSGYPGELVNSSSGSRRWELAYIKWTNSRASGPP